MPADLETDYALSALPPRLRAGASVYLFDAKRGYYEHRKGTNGFLCFVSRIDWEWEQYPKDLATPISYDAEGARTIFPVYKDVAAMGISGKYTPVQIRDTVVARMKRGYYKAPARPGVSYMLSPVMRVYPANPDNKEIVTMSFPHTMFYAPYMTNADIGGAGPHEQGPILLNAGQWILGERKAPHGYIIMPEGEMERAKILADGKDLVNRLIAYKPYFRVAADGGHH